MTSSKRSRQFRRLPTASVARTIGADRGHGRDADEASVPFSSGRARESSQYTPVAQLHAVRNEQAAVLKKDFRQ